MSRELLKKAINYVEARAGKSAFAENLLREIDEYLQKPFPDPVIMSNTLPTSPGWYWYELPGSWALQPALVFDGGEGHLLYTLDRIDSDSEDIERDGLYINECSENTLWSSYPIGERYWSDEMKCWTWGAGKRFLNPSRWMPLPEPPERKPLPEPVGYEYRAHHSDDTATPGWGEWERIIVRNHSETIEDRVREIQDYISSGYLYEMRALYSEPPSRNPLTDDEIIDIGFKAGFHVDTIINDETGDEQTGFINSDNEVDNECFFKLVRLIERGPG